MTENDRIYQTSELELASFLKARGHRLVGAKLDNRFVVFQFDDERNPANDVNLYFAGAQTPSRDLFEAHRSLRALIQQVREHSSQKPERRTQENEQHTHRT